ncbi:tetratricopeptide repeat protein, partial [Micromonospora foliorum]|uniref:tetratricopeptide repeat protein n=1 Tax=Micromonospora foliorum TaxID=2911210 RepID=UPI001EE7C92B
RWPEVGRHEEALARTEQAVTIRRRLAETNPTAHLPDLANSLNNLGGGLCEVGRHDEALAPTEQAVTIRRRLAGTNPTAHLPDLADSLHAHAWVCLKVNDNLAAAFDSVNEAIRLYESLAERLPRISSDRLFAAHQTLAGVREALGRVRGAADLRHLDQDADERQD